MNRRDLIKSLALLPVAETEMRLPELAVPRVFGVKETPWMIGKVTVYLDGVQVKRAVRGSVEDGWVEIFNADRVMMRHYGKVDVRLIGSV